MPESVSWPEANTWPDSAQGNTCRGKEHVSTALNAVSHFWLLHWFLVPSTVFSVCLCINLFLFLFLAASVQQLGVGSQFPDQGLKLGHSTERPNPNH